MESSTKKGFTLVELSLAIVFISILLLTIGFLTVHITSVYQKGLAMKAVNATAKELIDDVSRSIAGSPVRSASSLCLEKYSGGSNPSSAYTDCVNDNARKMIYQQRYGLVSINKKTPQLVPTNGVFCTGRYSYIWNTAYVLNPDNYENKGDPVHFRGKFNGDQNYRLKKVADFGRKLCLSHMDTDRYAYNSSAEYSINGNPTSVELLDNSENDLAIYDFNIFKPTIHHLTSSAFYSGTFILATLRGGIDINSTGNFCSNPENSLSTDFSYCAINKFNFSMQAAGEKTER